MQEENVKEFKNKLVFWTKASTLILTDPVSNLFAIGAEPEAHFDQKVGDATKILGESELYAN